jgi:hypothetical protein
VLVRPLQKELRASVIVHGPFPRPRKLGVVLFVGVLAHRLAVVTHLVPAIVIVLAVKEPVCVVSVVGLLQEQCAL